MESHGGKRQVVCGQTRSSKTYVVEANILLMTKTRNERYIMIKINRSKQLESNNLNNTSERLDGNGNIRKDGSSKENWHQHFHT